MTPADHPEATQRYVESIREDIERLLGNGIDLVDLQLRRVRGLAELRASYRMGALISESTGRGRTALEAHARLRNAIVNDRIGLGLRVLTRG